MSDMKQLMQDKYLFFCKYFQHQDKIYSYKN